ncbi:MAG: TetR-like C-terminal domain-containing protein [Liquorilactobacillus sp.]|uniref:TetR/AcrR family transcriptional regulator n=1 Tax=Liquorilactobacillus TaxID=2767888 RepID=UPI0039E89D52
MPNKKNNRAKKRSITNIENAFVNLLQDKSVNKVSITEICKEADVNRSTFYANFVDVFDLIEKLQDRMLKDFNDLYEYENSAKENSNNFLKLFWHIKENKILYKTYFKLGLELNVNIDVYDTDLAQSLFNNQHLDYHINFFRAGITATIKKWLTNDCDLSPEELFNVVKEEYQNKLDSLH